MFYGRVRTAVKTKTHKDITLSFFILVWVCLIRSVEQRQSVLEQDAQKNIGSRKKVRETWWKIHNSELRDPLHSPNFIGVLRSRRIKLVSHVTCVGETRNLYGSLVRNSERRFPFGRRKWENSIKMVSKQNGKESSGFIWLRIRKRYSEYSTELPGSTKCE